MYWRNRRISQRIFFAFTVALAGLFLSVLVGLASTIRILQANQFIVRSEEQLLALNELSYIIARADSEAGYIKRLVQTNPGLVLLQDDMKIAYLAAILEENGGKVNAVIRQFMPDKAGAFDQQLQATLGNLGRWPKRRDFPAIAYITSSLYQLRNVADPITMQLQTRLVKGIGAARGQIGWMGGIAIGTGLLIMVLLAMIILPLLREMRVMFSPMRQISENALQGAADALRYASEMDSSVGVLQGVLRDIGRGVEEVTAGAMESSSQVSGIMNAVKEAAESSGHLAEQASGIYDSLTADRGIIQQKAAQIQQLAKNVSQSLANITRNADVAAELTDRVTAFKDQLLGIEVVLASVNDITDQVELLALNASVEAARAGEQGAGFVVVADRLRRLAEQAKGFTGQIEETITGIQRAAKEAAGSLSGISANVRDSVSEVGQITLEMSDLEEVLRSLLAAHEKIIATASEQMNQARAIYGRASEIREATERISAQTQQVSGAMEELSAEGQEMLGQIELIGRNVSETRQVVERQVELARMVKETADRI